MAKKSVRFGRSWHSILDAFDEAKYSLSVHRVYTHLCKIMDKEYNITRSYPEVAKGCGIAIETARQALKKLIEDGWIYEIPATSAKDRQRGKSYHINELPPGTVEMHSEDPEISSRLEVLAELAKDAPKGALKDELDKLIRNLTKQISKKSAGAPKQNDNQIYEAPMDGQLIAHGEHMIIQLTKKQHDKLIVELGKEDFDRYITEIDNYLASNGKRYQNYYAYINRWASKDVKNTSGAKAAPPKRNRFANFKGRERDYAEIERQERQHLIDSLGMDNNTPGDDP